MSDPRPSHQYRRGNGNTFSRIYGIPDHSLAAQQAPPGRSHFSFFPPMIVTLSPSRADHPDIRQAFEGFHIETTDIRYTVGRGRGAERGEILIFSWDVAAAPAGLFWSHR